MVKFVPGMGRRPSDKASYKEVPLNLELQAEFQIAQFKLSHSRAFFLRAYPLQTHEMLFNAHNQCPQSILSKKFRFTLQSIQ